VTLAKLYGVLAWMTNWKDASGTITNCGLEFTALKFEVEEGVAAKRNRRAQTRKSEPNRKIGLMTSTVLPLARAHVIEPLP
jgi:hypothetical protein